VRVGDARGANGWLFTNAVVATRFELSFVDGVTAVVVPVIAKFPPTTKWFPTLTFPKKEGEAKVAYP
jgi:hypothetical protein